LELDVLALALLHEAAGEAAADERVPARDEPDGAAGPDLAEDRLRPARVRAAHVEHRRLPLLRQQAEHARDLRLGEVVENEVAGGDRAQSLEVRGVGRLDAEAADEQTRL